jgi:tetratricopeptide (TPR) repeat protein
MAVLKCKMCGGDIKTTDNAYGTCDSCGSTMTLPKASDDRKANLFNRANHFRRQNDFDKAVQAYENILNEDNADAEAHWGVVLSRYGIEYVEDPATGKRVPTCHRVQSESVLKDADYAATLEHAPDEYTRSLYEEEAKIISEIQKGILAISNKEKPYDVFICYKEATDGGSRTKDSTIAQDIYYELTKEGYRVFFSRITLEDKLGRDYEPYIFSALNSAKIMLVIGTRKEYFEATWVKNEWSRFLAIMKKDRSRLLIPCYRDMDAYDMPDELSHLQCQDMSKVGFIQDILRGIKKILDADKSEEKASSSGAGTSAAPVAPGIESLMKRGKLFLEDSDWKQADDYFNKVLDIDPNTRLLM